MASDSPVAGDPAATTGAGRSHLVFDLIGVLAVSGLVLVVCSFWIDTARLHVLGVWNDQVNYVTAGRNFLATGRWDSSVIYPSLLYQQTTKNYLYMPGHCLSLALSYRLFGYGVLPSLLPNLVAFVVASVCVYLAARRLYGRRAGLLAALLLMSCPYTLLFSFSAMAEMTFLAAVAIAFCLFVHLPPATRVPAAPFLLVIPFLFRETGALLVIPMALLILAAPHPRRLLRAGLAVLASVVVLAGVLQSPLASGRPSLRLANTYRNNNAKYFDAVANRHLPAGLGEFAAHLPKRVGDEARKLCQSLIHPTEPLFRRIPILVLGSLIPLMGLGAILRRDALRLGCAVLILVLFALLATFQTTTGWSATRNLMFVCPLVVTVVAGALARPWTRRCWAAGVLTSAVVAGAALCVVWFARHANTLLYAGGHTRGERLAHIIETDVGHNPNTVLVAHHPDIAEYLLSRYPARWSFLPANLQTLKLLNDRYDIGTILLPPDRTWYTRLTADDLRSLGFEQRGRCPAPYDYLIFQHGSERPPAAPTLDARPGGRL